MPLDSCEAARGAAPTQSKWRGRFACVSCWHMHQTLGDMRGTWHKWCCVAAQAA
jgi:hypothetical protein